MLWYKTKTGCWKKERWWDALMKAFAVYVQFLGIWENDKIRRAIIRTSANVWRRGQIGKLLCRFSIYSLRSFCAFWLLQVNNDTLEMLVNCNRLFKRVFRHWDFCQQPFLEWYIVNNSYQYCFLTLLLILFRITRQRNARNRGITYSKIRFKLTRTTLYR